MEGLDSHEESDEAVDDKGAMFHKGGYPLKGGRNHGQQEYIGGMNDELNHSDSEEMVQENPDFQGNDFVFKRRDGQQLPSNKNSTNKKSRLRIKNKGF